MGTLVLFLTCCHGLVMPTSCKVILHHVMSCLHHAKACNGHKPIGEMTNAGAADVM